MTGPEHYREAERLLALSNNMAGEWSAEQQRVCIAHAQVLATLALAAATAEPIAQSYAQSYDGPDDTTIPCAWAEAIS
jgi:phage tail sheath gpL-like